MLSHILTRCTSIGRLPNFRAMFSGSLLDRLKFTQWALMNLSWSSVQWRQHLAQSAVIKDRLQKTLWRLRRYATLCKSKWIGELQKMRCYFKISFPSVLGWRISRNPPSSFAPSQSSVRTPQWEPCKAHKASQSDEIAMLGGCFLIFRILSCQACWSALVEP